MIRLLLAAALLMPMWFVYPAVADDPEVPEAEPVQAPQTMSDWRQRVDRLTPGMTHDEVIEAMGIAPAGTYTICSDKKLTRMRYVIRIEGNSYSTTLFLNFTDGEYTYPGW